MSKVKGQTSKVIIQSGFTLIELMVVVTIMVILTTVMVLNLNGQRAARDVKIAQSELVSNLRKVQSYTLSGRRDSSGNQVQFYILKIDSAKPNQYTIQAVYNVSSSPQYVENVETVYLPPNIQFAATNPVVINRPNPPFVNFSTQSQSQTSMACTLVAFAAPFGKIFLNDGCALADTVNNPAHINSLDDYAKILPSNFISNTDCQASYGSPPVCTASVDSIMTITLTDSNKTVSKTITVNAVTGGISFN